MKGIILAGGKGERLRPYTDDRPKPMVPILDRPILEYQVRWFAGQGVKRIAISCGYLAEVIQDHFEDGRRFGVEIRYALEHEPLGRGGGIKLAWNELEDNGGPVIATNGDIVTAFPLAPMLQAHSESGAMATVLTVQFKSVVGIVEAPEERRHHDVGVKQHVSEVVGRRIGWNHRAGRDRRASPKGERQSPSCR